MKYDFDEIIDRRNDPYSFSTKWASGETVARTMLGVKRYSEDHIPMFSADMDFRCAQPILDALRREAEHGIFGYTLVQASHGRYYPAILGWFERRYRWTVRPEELFYMNGTLEGIWHVLRALCPPGSGVIVQPPVYGPFFQTVGRAGCRVVENRLLDDGAGYYTMDWEGLERLAAEEENRVLLLCHPHNPTGRIWSDEELLRCAEICRRNHVTILSDEIHCDLIRREAEFHPLAAVAGGEGIVTFNGVNKTFNLAGLQGTNMVIQDPALRERVFEEVKTIVPNPFTLAAMIAAYSEGEEWLEQCKDYLDGSIDFALDFLRQRLPKVKCRRPEGTYILWMDFRPCGLPEEEIRRRIYEEAQVYLESGRAFDPQGGAGFERMCVCTPRSLLQESLERIAREF